MNLFKTTLLSAMVAGLACANLSAIDPQDGEQEQAFMQKCVQDSQQAQNSEINDTEKLSKEELLNLLEELREECRQSPEESGVTHGAKALGWLGISGLFGLFTNMSFISALKSLGISMQNVTTVVEVCPTPWWTYTIPSYECNTTALYATGYALLAIASGFYTYNNGLWTAGTLRNAIHHMKAMINK